MLSAIASAGNFICLDRSRARATITGSFTAGIDGRVGPRATPGSLTSLAVISSTGLSAAGLATLAGIVVGAVNASVPAILLDSAGGVTDTALGTNTSTGALLFRSNSGNTSSTTIFLTAGTPYFIAASVKGFSNINFIALNLLTGSVQTQAVATANVINAGTSLTIGNFNATQSRGWTQPIAAVMASSVYLSMSQLLQWTADPWAFWYPDTPQFDYRGGVVTFSVVSDWPMGAENLTGLLRDSGLYADGLGGLQSDALLSNEHLAAIARDSSVYAENVAATQRDQSIGGENLAALRRDTPIYAEAKGALITTNGMAIEFLVALTQSSPMAAELRSALTSDTPISVEHLAGVLASVGVPMEFVGQVVSAANAYGEHLARVSSDMPICIEWLGAAAIRRMAVFFRGLRGN